MKAQQIVMLTVYSLFIIVAVNKILKSEQIISKSTIGYILASLGFLIHGIYIIAKYYTK